MNETGEDTALTMHQRRSSLAADGRRLKVRLGELHGRFWAWRTRVFAVLIGIYAVLPLLRVHGAPLILLDILHRRFFLFGMTFNAQDAYLLFFLVATGILSLVIITAMVGRVWCGWACPQTVFLEGVFRRLERWIEGPKAAQIKLEAGPWSPRKAFLIGAKHALTLFISALVANIFLSYFVSFESMRHWVLGDPREHWEAFTWMACITGAMYLNFAWFREQTCLILCPYGRIQSVLTDEETLVVGYDVKRGEPRGKKGTAGAGDCVNCYRCVDVCPTGIDIREGLQLECLACTNCIDACDGIMASLGRPKGLVRYASLKGFNGEEARFFRPRIAVYAVFFLLLGLTTFTFFRSRKPFEANLIRQQGLPYTVEGGVIRNLYFLHVVNKTPNEADFELALELPEGASALMPVPVLRLASLDDRRVPVVVQFPQASYKGEFQVISRVHDRQSGDFVESRLRFLGPT